MPDERLDFRTGARADVLDDRAALADDDLLLRLGLDEEECTDCLVVHLLDLDGDRVRDLVASQPQRLLADELRDLRLHREIGALLAREVQRPLRQKRDELFA